MMIELICAEFKTFLELVANQAEGELARKMLVWAIKQNLKAVYWRVVPLVRQRILRLKRRKRFQASRRGK